MRDLCHTPVENPRTNANNDRQLILRLNPRATVRQRGVPKDRKCHRLINSEILAVDLDHPGRVEGHLFYCHRKPPA
jgi:hypothetical protein